jgi:hypothetical protein
MKRIITYIFLLLINYSSAFSQDNKKDINTLIKLMVNIPDTINSNKAKEIPITLVIKNLSREQIAISNPSHWGNSIPFIRQKERLVPLIKVKPNPAHIDNFVILLSDSVYSTRFDYDLDKLFDLKANPHTENYEIFFRFYGNIKFGKKVIKTEIKSNIDKFYIK